MGKIKVYLDTNMIMDIFIAQARALKRGDEFRRPKKFEFMLMHSEKADYMTSFLTKAEVMRELLTGFNFTVEEADRMWDDFMDALGVAVHIEDFRFDGKLVEMVTRIRLRLRTLFNFMHLFISIKEDAYFISGDKDLISKIRQNKIYDKALDYPEFRDMISSLDPSSGG